MSCVQLQPLAPENFLSYSHLSHSVSSHLDSSPESSEAGADIPLSRTGEMLMWKYMERVFKKVLKSTECDIKTGRVK